MQGVQVVHGGRLAVGPRRNERLDRLCLVSPGGQVQRRAVVLCSGVAWRVGRAPQGGRVMWSSDLSGKGFSFCSYTAQKREGTWESVPFPRRWSLRSTHLVKLVQVGTRAYESRQLGHIAVACGIVERKSHGTGLPSQSSVRSIMHW